MCEIRETDDDLVGYAQKLFEDHFGVLNGLEGLREYGVVEAAVGILGESAFDIAMDRWQALADAVCDQFRV